MAATREGRRRHGCKVGVSVLSAWVMVLVLASRLAGSYAAVNGSDHINIWIVTHTHDDVGWLKTVDQYYISEVQWILDTAMRCLADDQSRVFTYVEQAYFYRWWNEQSDSARQSVIALVRAKQLEFNLGGWCMNDEGTTSFFSVINQMTEGALFLHDNLGADVYPKVGWHVDPFGHSSVTPSLWADMGFDAHGIDRIDFRIKDQRKASQELEFVWRGSRNFGPENQMFTHIMDSMYCTPGEASYDRSLLIQTDPLLPTYQLNFAAQGDAFVTMARQRNQWYRHDHILIPFGCDFAHQNAFKSFDQMDKLINYINSHSTLNATVRYGTFGTYIEAIHALNITWPTYSGDFFPYIPNYGQYFGGYLTSRPHLKGYIRSRAAVLRSTELLLYAASKCSTAGVLDWKASLEQVGLLRRAMAVSQHHDAISGTEKQAVADDYYLQLFKGTIAVDELCGKLLGALAKGSSSAPPVLYKNSSEVLPGLTSTEEIAVVVFNSLAWSVSTTVTVPLNSTSLHVFDETGKRLDAQQVLTIPEYDPDSNHTSHQLIFIASLAAFGFQTYFLREGSPQNVSVFTPVEEDFEIENSFLKAFFSAENHTLDGLAVKPSQQPMRFQTTMAQYMSAAGNAEPNSGNYVFRPMQDNHVHVGSSKTSGHFELGWSFFEPMAPYDASGFPLLLATSRSDPKIHGTETFVASVSQPTTHGVTFQVSKVGGVIWGQDNWLDYAALHPTLSPIRELAACAGILEYSYQSLSKSSVSCAVTEIKLTKSFQETPLVFATVSSPSNQHVSFAATVDPSPSSVKVNVCRADLSGGFDTVNINILAVAQQEKPCVKTCWGQAHYNGVAYGTRHIVVPTTSCEVDIFSPMVLAAVQSGSGQVYGVSSFNVSASSIAINVQPLSDEKKWSDNLTVSWLIFERNTIRMPVVARDKISVSVARGPVVQEVRQVFKDHYAVTHRLYQGVSPEFQFLEQKFDIGPLDLGRELVTTFEYEKHSNVWYSDDSGLELIPRTFDGGKDEPVGGNFYPMVMGIYMNDTQSNFSLSVLSERSHSSAHLGQDLYEIMLHRRCLDKDGFGVGEVLNETDHIQPRLWFVPSLKPGEAFDLRHKLTLQLQNPPYVMFGKEATGQWLKQFKSSFSVLAKALPENLHLLSLKVRNGSTGDKDPSFLLRLLHTYERGEPSPLAARIDVDLSQYFAEGCGPDLLEETTLTGNRPLSSVRRLQWRTADDEDSEDRTTPESRPQPTDRLSSVGLVPRQIRTFTVR